VSELRGEVETEEGVLLIRRILVHHRLMAQEELRGVVEAVHNDYPLHCPLYRTLYRCIDIKTFWELVSGPGPRCRRTV
jgi:hypothetical protein